MFRRRTGSPDDPEGAGGLLITPTKSPADGFSRRQRQRGSRLSTIGCLGLLLLAVWAFASGHLMFSRTPARGALAQQADRRRLPDGSWAPTLCIYVFSNTDPEYLENLRFFVKFGMSPDDGVTYLVVVQEQEGQPVGREGLVPGFCGPRQRQHGRDSAPAAVVCTSSSEMAVPQLGEGPLH